MIDENPIKKPKRRVRKVSKSPVKKKDGSKGAKKMTRAEKEALVDQFKSDNFGDGDAESDFMYKPVGRAAAKPVIKTVRGQANVVQTSYD